MERCFQCGYEANAGCGGDGEVAAVCGGMEDVCLISIAPPVPVVCFSSAASGSISCFRLSAHGRHDCEGSNGDGRWARCFFQCALLFTDSGLADGADGGVFNAAFDGEAAGEVLAVRSVHRQVDGGVARVVVEVAAPPGTPVELFAEGPSPDWALPLPEADNTICDAP